MRNLILKIGFFIVGGFLWNVAGPGAYLHAQTAQFSGDQLSGCSPLTVRFTDNSTGTIHTWFWDFGNGNTSQFDDVIAIYTNPGTYTVSLTVTDTINGVSDTRTEVAYVTVFADPLADFTVDTTSGCAPLNVTFTDATIPGDGTLNTWSWDYGDGTVGSGAPSSHTYNTAGTYTVTLVVEDDNGCQDTRIYNDLISVTEVANVDFTAAPQTACSAPLNVNFNSSVSPAGNYTYQWDFGDGNGSTAANPSHTYTANGDYTITLTLMDAFGCQEMVQKDNFVIINQPTAAFVAADSSVCSGRAVQFINNSLGADSYNWDFGDGNSSNAANPTHTYSVPGTYTVTLTANNSAGCSDFAVGSNMITVFVAPAPSFSVSNNIGCDIPLLVSFTDNSVGNIIAWDWDFGNGNFSTGQSPITTYTNPGAYGVSMTVTTADGCQATETIPDLVLLQAPDADFITGNVTGCVPLTVPFFDQSISPADPITTWLWNFGDGNFSNAQNPSHTYSTPGQYTVTLTVTTASGCTNTETFQFVEAGTRPNADFTAVPTTVCVGDNVNFQDLTTGGATNWAWSFGDGGGSNQQNPIHAYLDTGLYTVVLVVEYLGCPDTLIVPDLITVVGPTPNFLMTPLQACNPPSTINFFDQSVNATSLFWDFGDGNTSTLANPANTFLSTGTYVIDLVATDSVSGCTNNFTQTINITNPRAGFGPSQTRGCFPFTVNFTNSSVNTNTYLWDFGDGNIGTAANPTHTYQAPGVYTVSLIAGDGLCADTLIMTSLIEVVGPVAAFAADTLTGCAPFSVTFSDSSQAYAGTNITTWQWDFGDGGTGSGPNPTYTFSNAGIYDIGLTILDSEGCQATTTLNSYIQPTFPEADFTTADTISCPGSFVSFRNLSTGVGLSYLWDFGDGSTATTFEPDHFFPSNGIYTITLTATDVNGCVDTRMKVNFVNIGRPTAAFATDTTNATCPPLTVNFTDQSSPDVVSWFWDFGDGSTSTLANPGKIYAVAGSYDVTLVVTNTQGCTDTLRSPSLINISGPTGTFSYSPTVGCQPLDVTFTANSPNPAWTYDWDFGDGIGGTGASVMHTYTVDTVANPVMLITDGSGCVVPVAAPTGITIQPLPVPSFNLSANQICLGETISLTNTSSSDRPVTEILWTFGDGDSAFISNPSHTYTDTGTFTITLALTTVDGCATRNATPVTIRVTTPPTAAYVVDTTQSCTPFPVTFTQSSTGDFVLVDYAWDFGDGNTDNGAVISPHTYTTPGTYIASLIITDTRNCRDTLTRTLTAHELPPVDFSAFRYGCGPISVSFSDETLGSSPAVAWLWDFGDGNTSTLQNPTHFYAADGYYTISLTVTDANGCVNTLVRPDYIQLEHPTANFTSNAGITCPPQTVNFTDLSVPDTTISWQWDFGDGATSTQQNPSHTYYTADTFDVTLIIENIFGCTDTIIRPQHVITYVPPTADFTVSDTADCVPATLTFTQTSTASGAAITGYLWDFGTGSGVTTPNASFFYTTAGTYTVSLVVTDQNGCRDTASQDVFINANPAANFVAADTVGCAITSIQFTDQTSGTIPNAWQWTFGDGSSSTAQNPANTYFADGSYDVKLVVTDVNGCVDSLTKAAYINLDHPTANFNVDQTKTCPETAVTFSDLSTGNFGFTNWQWNFGDGSAIANGNNPSHSYSVAGIYDITLIVTDQLNCRDTLTMPTLVEVYQAPTAAFTASTALGCEPLTVNFTDASVDGSAAVVAYQWDFGDGGNAVVADPVYVYNTPGVYTIELIVTDANGCQDTTRQSVEILEKPVVDFTADKRRGCAPETITFTDLSTSPYVKVSWLWDFGDGNTSNSPAPVHTYLSDGIYTVKLVVTDQNGCQDSITKANFIRLSHPRADFSFDQTVVCPNSPIGVSFTDLSTGDTTLIGWAWDFGDGATAAVQHPTHSYSTPGSYTVTLTVTDMLSCTDVETKTALITVLNPISTGFTQDQVANCTPLTISFTDTSTAGDAPITAWSWAFGDGNTSLQQNPTHTWTTPGTYTVVLTTTDGNSCQTQDSISVQAYEIPEANFIAVNPLGCAPQLVQFQDQSTTTFAVAGRRWYFGDGDSAINVLNPSHFYANDGDYDVSLIITDVNGCADTLTRNSYVRLSHPTAAFSLSQTSVCPGIPVGVSFTDNSIADTTLVGWLWEFGDGTTSTLQHPSHSFSVSGTYSIILTVTNILGCTDSDTVQNNITVLAPPSPVIIAADTADCVPFNAVFTDASVAGDAPIVSWRWRFGNGDSSLVPSPSYTYPTAGIYTVTLLTRDANGCADSTTLDVEAYGLPTAAFVALDTVGCAPAAISFQDQSTGPAFINQWAWTFGDGNTSALQDPTHPYTTDGTYSVSLAVTDINNCSDTQARTDYIELTHPVANFIYDQPEVCPGTGIQFTDLSAPDHPLTDWLWDFGDGNTSTQQNPLHVYHTPGLYSVSLTVTNALTCTDTEVKTAIITVYQPPTAATVPGDTAGCMPFTVDFSDGSLAGDAGLASWVWDFGNGNTGIGFNPVPQTYPTAGNYTVTLTVEDANACRDTVLTTITVHTPPNTNFVANQTTGCAPAAIRFTDLTGSLTAIVGWEWSFGDGGSSTAQNPTHIYLDNGVYDVELITFDANGCSDTLLRTAYIDLSKPTAAFTSNATDICPGQSVNFFDTSLPDTTLIGWAWDFGDGSSSIQQNPTHLYTTTGTYTVRLIITNTLGCTDTITQVNYIEVAQAPVAGFVSSDTVDCAPFSVNFVNVSTPSTSPIASYAWDFGNGATSAQLNPSTVYTTPGTYTSTLVVTDQNGCTDTTRFDLTATTLPQPDFSATPRIGCAPETVSFINSSTGDFALVGYLWDFGDGTTSTDQFPTHTYAADGLYSITLTVTDINGCSNSLTRLEYIRLRHPIADFSFSSASTCPGTALQFSDASTPDTTLMTWDWDFGDGTTGTGPDPQHVYTVAGSYTVTLTVTNVLGCTDTEVKTASITVNQAPTAAFAPDVLAGCVPLDVNFANTSTVNSQPIVSYAWDFGTGDQSSLNAPFYTFVNPGTYAVSLVATDALGCTDTFAQNITVFTLPNAAFTASDSFSCAPVNISFLSTSAGDFPIVSWAWTFGDGGSSTSPTPVHPYANDGSYDVSLIVVDANGCTDALFKPAYINLSHPTAAFSVDQNQICPGVALQFTDQSLPDTTLMTWNWDFGDGNGSAAQNPNHIYTQPGNYTVTLTVTNVLNCSHTISQANQVEVVTPPLPSFTLSDTIGCAPLLVNTVNTSQGQSAPIVSYYWDFGNGDTAVVQSPSILYPVAGVYALTLTATDLNGCSSDTVVQVTVVERPVANFLASDTAGCVEVIDFFDLSTSDVPLVSWLWEFGDGDSATLQNPSHTYLTSGVYTVRLTVVDAYGCSDTLTRDQYINLTRPVAAFGQDLDVICPGSPLQFIDQSLPDHPITNWDWDFGDGNTGSAQNPIHTYQAAGIYTVTLTITNIFGCTATAAGLVEVLAPPIADLSTDQTSGCTPLPINFTDQSVGISSNVIFWEWTFGDGSISTLQNPSHIYTSPGTYLVNLRALDANGCLDDTTISVTALPVPEATFSANQAVGCAPSTLTFTGAVNSINPIIAWDWDFGDGTTGSGQVVSHVYTTDGLYTVRLIVEDINGCRDTVERPEYVRLRHPVANFNWNPPIGCPVLTVQFNDTSVPDTTIVSWFWDFGDGNTSTGTNPNHAYATPGTYTVSLTVTNVLGCTDTEVKSNIITVRVPPTAEFTMSDSVGCAPFTTQFFQAGVGNAAAVVSYQWQFGTGDVSFQPNPSYTFSDEGIYPVTLIVGDANGCTDTIVHQVEVLGLPAVLFDVNPAVGCAPQQVGFVDQSLAPAPVVSWLWDFGDGNTSTQQFPSHTYTADGLYDVELTVTDANGCTSTLLSPDRVRLRHPVADFTVNSDVICPGSSVNFTDVSTPDTTLNSWFWDFGDGNTSTQQNPSHFYGASGTFTVSLTIRNVLGCEDVVVKVDTIQVLDKPTANFSPSTLSGCGPLYVEFVNTSVANSAPIATWQWTFGNGNSSIFTDPDQTFATPGVYPVRLIATDSYGCTDTTTRNIEVFVSPSVSFTASDSVGCAPENINFLDQTTAGDAPLTTWLWTFGDGGSSIQQFANHTYTADGLYDVQLVVIDANSCRDTLLRPQYIDLSRPAPEFIVSSTQTCPGTVVSFADQTLPDTTLSTWLWDFGDGTTSTQQNPIHTYTSGGNYTVSLTVTNVLGCSQSITKNSLIQVLAAPAAIFTANPPAGCSPALVSFLDNSVGTSSPLVAWTWSFGDGDSAFAQNPDHLFSQPGTYPVSLTVTDNNGCEASFSQAVEVHTLPVANFMSVDTVGCSPITVSFSDLSTGDFPIVSWNWDFGDGATSSVQFPTHSYTADGSYTITLVVTDANGCQNTLVRPDYIRLRNPRAEFTFDSPQGCPGLEVNFTDASIPDTTLISWFWDFGDGATSQVQSPAHVYQSPGLYTVSLTVTNILGCAHTETKPNAVSVSVPPVAAFSLADSIQCAPFALDIRDLSSVTSAAIRSWHWDFGNGDSAVVQEPDYSYQNPGNYTITLTITDALGCMDTAVVNATATDAPVVDFMVSDSVGCAPAVITYTNLTQTPYDIVQWEWNFGDGTRDNAFNTFHVYTQDGSYTVSLTVLDEHGCRDTLERPDLIRLSHPKADFNADVDAGCEGTEVQFTDMSLVDTTLTGWAWNFGDGGTSVQPNPQHRYASTGTYDVSLIVTNVLGCADTLRQPQAIEIFEGPIAAVEASDTSGCVPFQVDFTDFSTSPAGITGWQWFLDDVPKGNSQNISHYFVVTGEYDVMLVVTDANGCTDTVRQTVFVRPVPVAAFTVSDSLGCGPAIVQFTDASVHRPNQWLWDFGDGITSNVQNPVHTYDEDGIYTVSLQIIDQYGCTDEVEEINVIRLDHPDADFTIDYTPACPPVRANFVGSGSGLMGIAKWEWNFGDGVTTTTLVDSVVHAYNQAGTYQVSLTATDSLGCSVTITKNETIEVLADVIPAPLEIHALSVLSDRQLEVKFAPHRGADFQSYTIYREEIGVGFVPVYTSNYIADTIWVDETVQADQQNYCYKVTATNYCGTESNLGLTDAHCSVELTATPVPGEIRLNWTPYRGWESVDHYEVYEVESYGQRGQVFLGLVPGNQTSYVVPFADCFNQVDYRVRAIGTRNIEVSWSDTTRAANETGEIGDAMEVVRATVENNEAVLIEWKPAEMPGIAFIKVQRSINGIAFTNYVTLPPGEVQFTDPQVNVQLDTYAYRVYAEDSCGNTTPPSNIGETILLNVEQNLKSALLNWSPYAEWQTGVNRYRIEVFNDTLGEWTFVDHVDGSSFTFKDEETSLDQPRLCYRVVALEEVGNDAISISNEGCIRVETSLIGPNAFTPNGDDVNDYFYLSGIHVQTFDLQIYSRWGLKVFETNNLDGKWDGTFKGSPVKEGVYVYVARGVGFNGEPYVLKGTITLYR